MEQVHIPLAKSCCMQTFSPGRELVGQKWLELLQASVWLYAMFCGSSHQWCGCCRPVTTLRAGYPTDGNYRPGLNTSQRPSVHQEIWKRENWKNCWHSHDKSWWMSSPTEAKKISQNDTFLGIRKGLVTYWLSDSAVLTCERWCHLSSMNSFNWSSWRKKPASPV